MLFSCFADEMQLTVMVLNLVSICGSLNGGFLHKDALIMINLLTAEDAFSQGVGLYNKKEFGTSIPYFLHALRKIPKDHRNSNEYMGFYGLCLMRLGNRDEGFNKCIVAAETELNNPEVFLTLARAALLMSRRKMALKAISQGLAIDSSYKNLHVLRRELGVRRDPTFGFLSRNNYLNIFLGRLSYKTSHS